MVFAIGYECMPASAFILCVCVFARIIVHRRNSKYSMFYVESKYQQSIHKQIKLNAKEINRFKLTTALFDFVSMRIIIVEVHF